MANAELVTGAVPISTYCMLYIFKRVYTDALTIAGLRRESCNLHLQNRVQIIIYKWSAYEIVCVTSFLAETSYKVNNCFQY